MPRAVLLVVLGLVLTAPAAARADVQWLCKPGLADSPCTEDLTTRRYEENGDSLVQSGAVPTILPPVDCFYVYPTVSNQPTTNATKAADPEVRSIARFQASRFSARCSVYAPLYRQVTVTGVLAASQTRDASPYTLAYEDVREAFRAFLRTQDRGRGFVLVGHSQGSRILRRLIRDEVDGVADVRRRLVSAIIPGANATSEDFANVPACVDGTSSGCVVSYHTFDEVPPANARFGRTDTDPVGGALGLPRGGEVLCTDPAVLTGQAGQPLETLVPSAPFAPGVIGALLLKLYGGPPPSSPDTPWLRPVERYTSACVQEGGARVLRIAPVGAARKLSPSPDATWGVHLVDLNLPLGNLVELVGTQTAAYRQRAVRPLSVTLGARRAGVARRQLTVTVRGAPRAPLRVSLARGGSFVVRRALTLDRDGVGRLRFRVRRAGGYVATVRSATGTTTRSRARRITLR